MRSMEELSISYEEAVYICKHIYIYIYIYNIETVYNTLVNKNIFPLASLNSFLFTNVNRKSPISSDFWRNKNEG